MKMGTLLADSQLILYAIPLGPFADQLQRYFAESRMLCGANKAHAYEPHCTLTGFIQVADIHRNDLIEAARTAIEEARIKNCRDVAILERQSKLDFIGFQLASPWLLAAAQRFRDEACSRIPGPEVRLKLNLHVSLAYGFRAVDFHKLAGLADTVFPREPVASDWRVELFQRSPSNEWARLAP